MSNYNVRTFSRSANKISSANDYINRKKAENLYLVSTTNGFANNGNKSLNSNTPVKTSIGPMGNQRLRSVGGFNVNSYDLFMNISKGRYYTATDGRKIEKHLFKGINSNNPLPNEASVKIDDCSATTFLINPSGNKLTAPISQNWDLYEGSYLINRQSSLADLSYCKCTPNTISKDSDITIVPIVEMDIRKQIQASVARWNNTNPLRGFNFPQSICMPMPNRKH